MTLSPLARKWILRIHMYCGLVLAVYGTIIGISGSLLTFRDVFEDKARPEIHPGTGSLANPVLIDPDAALTAVRQAVPEGRPISLTWPNARTPFWMSYVLLTRGAREVYIDISSGKVAAVRDPQEGWIGQLSALHTNLLAGSTGRALNSYGAWGFLILSATGSVLWWPGTARWRSRFRLELRSGWRKLSWRLHHITGAVSLAFIVVLAFTGTYFYSSRMYVQVVSRFFTRTVEPKPAPSAPASAILSMSRITDLARAALPGKPIHRIQIVERANQVIRITYREGEPEEFHLVSTVFLHPVTGEVLYKNLLSQRPAGDSILAWFSALHFGVFGGLPIKILWFILGFSLPMLGVTGCLLWWRRVVEPLRRKETHAEQIPAAVA